MCRCRPLGTHAAAPGCPPAHHDPYPIFSSTVLRLLLRHRGASDCLACHSHSHILTVPYSMLSCWAFSESNWGTVTECYGQSELYSAEMFCLVVLGAGYQQIWSLVRDCFLSIVACLLTLSSKSRGDSLVSLCVDISYTDKLVYVWDVLFSNILQVRVSIYKFGV